MNLKDALSSGRPRKRRKRVGRGPGSGHGKTSTRGHKGARSRSSWKTKLSYEGGQMPLFRRLPKRGFNNAAFGTEFEIVNVERLAQFEAGSVVGPEELRSRKIVKKNHKIKILGAGSLDRALTVRANGFSKSAVQKIEAAGGRAEVI
jgi:large subunit ribosomal protein L15